MMAKSGIRFGLVVLLLLVVVASVAAQDMQSQMGGSASARVVNAAGEDVGIVTFEALDETRIVVSANVRDLTPGWHGFHVHAVGVCDATTTPPFTSAGGHVGNDMGEDHPMHTGDMPPLFAMQDGTAMIAFVTDHFTMADLLDADGSAVMVHALPNNFAHIPDRYLQEGETIDEETLSTGDSGERVACGVVTENVTTGDMTSTPMPGGDATAVPTAESTMEMTPEVTVEPTSEATMEMTPEVTDEPTDEATMEPTMEMTPEVTANP